MAYFTLLLHVFTKLDHYYFKYIFWSFNDSTLFCADLLTIYNSQSVALMLFMTENVVCFYTTNVYVIVEDDKNNVYVYNYACNMYQLSILSMYYTCICPNMCTYFTGMTYIFVFIIPSCTLGSFVSS